MEKVKLKLSKNELTALYAVLEAAAETHALQYNQKLYKTVLEKLYKKVRAKWEGAGKETKITLQHEEALALFCYFGIPVSHTLTGITVATINRKIHQHYA